MKTRRLFSLIAATCALVLSTATFAQPAAGPKPRERVQMTAAELRERRMKQLDDRLQLSGEQKTKIHAIWDSAAEQLKAIQGSYPLVPGDKQKRLRALAQQTREQIRVILTPVQVKVYDTMPIDQPQPRRTAEKK